jgi:prevent-host-death family protein
MAKSEPTTRNMSLSQAKDRLSQVVNTVYRRESRILLEEGGVPVAALVSPEDLRALEQFDQQRAKAFRVIDELQAAFADVSEPELEKEIDRALTEVRAERRAEVSASPSPQ